MIVLDLEWNRGYDRTPLDEIIQIGAVRTAELGGPVLDTFQAYIRPVVHKKFDRGAKQLPDLRQSRESELSFAEAMEQFRAWCGEEREFALWGGDDLSALTKNCEYWQVPPLEIGRMYNFQTALAWLMGADQQIALWRAVDYFGIPDTFDFHNALNDAMYTALIGRWLTQESLEYVPDHRKKKHRRVSLRLSSAPFVCRPGQAVGPYPTAELALDGKSSRRPACPVCGRRGCVAQWRLAPGTERGVQDCYSVFSCGVHGRFLCRLELTRQGDGQWQGLLSVPEAGPELVQAYLTACEGGVHNCRHAGTGGRKRKRRSSRRRR